jgi:hypothetical protein
MANADNVKTPAAATAATYTIAAVAGHKNSIQKIFYSYSAAPTGGRLLVESPSGTTIFDTDITAAGPGSVDFGKNPLIGGTNSALIVTLASGAGAVAGKLVVHDEVLKVRK